MGERPRKPVGSVAAFRYLASGAIPLLLRLRPFLELHFLFACARVLARAVQVGEADVLVVGVDHDALILFEGLLIANHIGLILQFLLVVFLLFLVVEVLLVLHFLLFALVAQLLVEPSIQLRQDLLVRIRKLRVRIIDELDRLALVVADILILTIILVLVDLAVVLPDEVLQRVLLLLRICHRLGSRREVLRILLPFLQGRLPLDAARFAAFGPGEAGLRCLFQVPAAALDFHEVFGTFLGVVGLAGFGSREVCVAGPVF